MTSDHGERALADDLVGVVVRLVRRLRARGLLVTPGSSVDALQALSVVDVLDREEVRNALRVVLVSRPEDLPTFDGEFAIAWDALGGLTAPMPDLGNLVAAPHDPLRRAPRAAPVTLQNWMKPEDVGTDQDPLPVMAPSAEELLTARDFSTYSAADTQAFRRLATRIARRLALRRSRRWKATPRGRTVDLRGTMRWSVRTAGELLRVQRRSRRIRRTRLLALCDVSGSMELYSRFLLQFLHALQNTFASVETYVFATRLSRITEQLRGAAYRDALQQLGQDVRDWSGGTRIGQAVESLVRDHYRLLDRRTIVLILSDGWDVGEPEVLEQAMRALRKRVAKVIWLNPLMGAADYSPATRGMRAALDHVDLLAPAHNLESLERLVPRLIA
ncbi:MAG: vWA domain-containing protein [Gemmatimonadaceae bacterium]